jgi:hypothetical protein
MNYKQIYIGVNREVKKYKEDYELSSADITYWLNKALISLINDKYKTYESNERIKRELYTLYDTATLTPSSTITFNSTTNGYVIDLSSSNIMYTINERSTILYNSISYEVGVKDIKHDNLNDKLEDPYSEHKVHLNKMKPLKIDRDNEIVLITTSDYSIVNYKIQFIKIPDLFVIANSISASSFGVLPEILHNELITYTVRMILENEKNPRYQTILNEENKLK